MVGQKGERFQFWIILIHDTDKNIKFPIVETFFHFIGGFIAELDLDIRPFRVETRQDHRETDMSAVGRDSKLQVADTFFGKAGRGIC